MTSSTSEVPDVPPVLPPEVRNGDERATLVALLEYYRAVLTRKAWGLTPEQLQQTTAASELTLGGLVKHMAYVENWWFWDRFAGNPPGQPWAGAPWHDDPDWDHHSAAGASAAELLGLFDAEVARSRVVVAAASSLGNEAAHRTRRGEAYNLRWVLVHMIEEYARHCGHADLIRESVDGAVGD